MTNSYEWDIKEEREQLGKLIKLIVSKHSDETLGKWYQTLQKDSSTIAKDLEIELRVYQEGNTK